MKQVRAFSWPQVIVIVLAAACVAGIGVWAWQKYGQPAWEAAFSAKEATPHAGPVALAPPLRSQMPLQQVTAYLDQNELVYSSDRINLPAIGDSPAKKLDTLRVPDFRHLGINGVLTLHFFQGLLYESVFEPDVVTEYAHAVRKHMGLRPDPRQNGRSERIQGNQRIASNVYMADTKVGRSLDTQPFMLWQDLHLLKKRQR